MPRPTSASRCSQEATVIVANQPVAVACQRAEGHQAPVQWPSKATARPLGRKDLDAHARHHSAGPSLA
jgi:hypothetical protein